MSSETEGQIKDDNPMPPPPPPEEAASTSTILKQLSVDEYLAMSKPAKYVIGDLIWSKMTGHPMWPCMVTEDPLQSVYTKFTGKGQRLYHCQFFGSEAERSWVSESATMKYEGKDAFLKFTEDAINSAGTKAQRKQACQKYEVKPGRRAAWDLSSLAADHALTLDREERKKVYTFHYIDLQPPAPQPEPVQSDSVVEPAMPLPPPKPPSKAKPKRKAPPATPKPAVKKTKMTTIKPPTTEERTPKQDSISADPFEFDDDELQELPPSPVKKFKPSPPKKLRRSSTSSTSSIKLPAESQAKTVKHTPKPKAKVPVGEATTLEKVYEIERLVNHQTIKKSPVCIMCEKPESAAAGEALVQCTGACMESYHTGCANITEPENYKCHNCTNESWACMMCKQMGLATTSPVQKCSVKDCGKFYHIECINVHPLGRLENNNIICPQHICTQCACGDSTVKQAQYGKFYRCIRCPTAYHTGHFCIAAGSVVISGNSIICSGHFQAPTKSANKNHQHINVNWCFTCSLGGTLVCCESCPAAFHKECLQEPVTDGLFFCHECKLNIKPKYGDIVWVKLGSYRWWPSEICHPDHVPLNIQHKSHRLGEFPVHFLGCNDYYWTHQGRVFAYHEGDKASKDSASAKNLDKMYKTALLEAAEAFTLVQTIRENKDEKIIKVCDSKPRKYKYIKVNLPIPPVALNKIDQEQIAICDCNPNDPNPCGDDTCLNRMMFYECHPRLCQAGDQCKNQRLQKRVYPKQEPVRVGDNRGFGLKAKQFISQGALVNEYVGEIITESECQRRIKEAHENNITSFYMLTLDNNRILDAGPKGNLSRFANHSCQPNVKTQKWFVNGNWKVGLFALTDIQPGTELTFNYNLVSVGETKLKCLCKAPNCTGFIGERPVKPVNNSDKTNKPKKIKKRVKKPKHEDACFRCRDGGDLMLCDRAKCLKSYHLACLGLEKVPFGKWDCPWHHCDTCGKPSTVLCVSCPNSFCLEHSTRNVTQAQGLTFCRSHSNEEIQKTIQLESLNTSPPSTPQSTSSNGS